MKRINADYFHSALTTAFIYHLVNFRLSSHRSSPDDPTSIQ